MRRSLLASVVMRHNSLVVGFSIMVGYILTSNPEAPLSYLTCNFIPPCTNTAYRLTRSLYMLFIPKVS